MDPRSRGITTQNQATYAQAAVYAAVYKVSFHKQAYTAEGYNGKKSDGNYTSIFGGLPS